jgi:hypothetical protein
MFDFMLDRVGAPMWISRSKGTVKFHREYSRFITNAGQTIQGNVFDYRQGEDGNNVAALTSLLAAGDLVNWLDTSLREENHVNESYWATHLRIAVQTQTTGTNIAADTVLVQADWDELEARTFFQLFHEKQDQPEVEGFMTEFPAGEGPYVESTNVTYFHACNGSPWIQAARPLPKPLYYRKATTWLGGRFLFGTNRGNVAPTQETGLMVYLDGFRVLKPSMELSGEQSAVDLV